MKGKQARVEAGYQNNATPFGYVKGKGKDAVAQIDPEAIKGYHLAVRLALEGRTDLQIAWALNEAGYRTRLNRLFSKDSVRDVLEKRYYLGEVVNRKQWHPGRHAAAIDRETWERVQAIRGARAPRANKANIGTRPFPLTTVLYCAECGSKMRGGGDRLLRIYRCTGRDHALRCSQGQVNAETLEAQVSEFIARLHLPEDWKAKALAMMGEDTGEIERIESQRRRLEGELKRARALFVAGDMPEAEYNQHRERIALSLRNLVMPTVPDLSQAALILSDFGRAWALATGEERKQIVTAVLARVWAKDKTVAGIEPKAGPYYLLANAEVESPVGSASGILLIPPGAQVEALFNLARHVAHEEIPQ